MRDDGASHSLAVSAALALLRGYKLLISPYFRGSCRFLPSCADYAAEALALHGFWQGTWLTLGRLSRCHPLARSGVDPVPGRINRWRGHANLGTNGEGAARQALPRSR